MRIWKVIMFIACGVGGLSSAYAQQFSTICQFEYGPMAGKYRDYAPLPPLPVKAPCTDGISTGHVVAAMPNVPSQPNILASNVGALLYLPVSGAWRVVQGPPCPAPGNHCMAPSNNLAIDIVPVSGTCLGQPIRSPAAGTVVESMDGIPDMPSQNVHPAGNHVVLRVAQGAYVILAHFRQGSVAVAQGASVAAGQHLGICGLSGNTSGPHLHISMQNSPNALDFSGAAPLPLVFQQVPVSKGGAACQFRTNYSPVQNDIFC